MSDISFSSYRKNDIHGVSLYPATMIAPVQHKIMASLFRDNDISSVYDPYHGSGTALFEAAKLDLNCNIIGCDINPLAHLITYSKLKGVTQKIEDDIQSLFFLIEKTPEYNFEFDNISKWFRADIIASLKKIRWAITQISSKRNRAFFWIVFANTIRKYSNSRSSTYKLHIKDMVDINRLHNNVIRDFQKQVENNYQKFTLKAPNVTLLKGDILKMSRKLADRSMDLTITSPPYGDNQTTVPYGQFSSLALFWIDSKDLKLEGWELDNYSKIDRMSLGGQRKNTLTHFGETLLEPYLNEISKEKQTKVINFFADYFISLDDICRVTDKYIVMTLGNRTVDRININLTEITSRYLESNGFILVNTLSRDIPIKRTPRLTSKVRNEAVSSMNEEFVIIHSRQ
ncbi:modification methylase [Acinetobacter sp. ANC 5600]|uniref:modification methylase n=1 Tax=Acinetobacter sp. ANC 5600 TaxID=1960940 RepID=UPI0009932463|nr:modification methylase [Acinetobacter sp. ANC 5600]OOV81431.1 modification methylase [Acinetobacter sp. ANC 5600]